MPKFYLRKNEQDKHHINENYMGNDADKMLYASKVFEQSIQQYEEIIKKDHNRKVELGRSFLEQLAKMLYEFQKTLIDNKK